jgi:hypothetical protein
LAKENKGSAVRMTVKNGANKQGGKTKYDAMKKALLAALARKAMGLTYEEMAGAVMAYLPTNLLPGGAKAGWWTKTVQLDLEEKGVIVRGVGVESASMETPPLDSS